MTKNLMLLLFLPLLCACASMGLGQPSPSLTPANWLNAPVEGLIAAFGEPNSSAEEGSEQRYTWQWRVAETELGYTYLGSDGKVKRHPNVVTSKKVLITATANSGFITDFVVTPIKPMTWTDLFRKLFRSDEE